MVVYFYSVDTALFLTSLHFFFYPKGSVLAMTPSSKSNFNTFSLKLSKSLSVIKSTATSNHPLQLYLTGAFTSIPPLSIPLITQYHTVMVCFIDSYWRYRHKRRFITWGKSKTGFLFSIQPLWLYSLLPALCGGNITSMNGTIYSPGHPAEYPHFQDCMWTVRVPPGYGIYINFSVINTEPIYDYITVW